jgi:hypothetical protein
VVELGELDLGVDGLAGAGGVDLEAGDADEAFLLLQRVQALGDEACDDLPVL